MLLCLYVLDDLIGMMAISLHDIITAHTSNDNEGDSSTSYYTFHQPIYNNALQHGSLKGKIHLTPVIEGMTTIDKCETIQDLKMIGLDDLGLSTAYTLG
jgi:hypothetical protein